MASQYSPDSTEQPGLSSESDLVKLISGQQLKFDALSRATIRQLLYERQGIRDKNHADISGQITDVSGYISCCENLRYDPNARAQELRLAKLKADLERESRDQDTSLWKDTFELRRALIDAEKRYESSNLRSGLIFPEQPYDESKPIPSTAHSRYVSGP
jgi:hypothetical protein